MKISLETKIAKEIASLPNNSQFVVGDYLVNNLVAEKDMFKKYEAVLQKLAELKIDFEPDKEYVNKKTGWPYWTPMIKLGENTSTPIEERIAGEIKSLPRNRQFILRDFFVKYGLKENEMFNMYKLVLQALANLGVEVDFAKQYAGQTVGLPYNLPMKKVYY